MTSTESRGFRQTRSLGELVAGDALATFATIIAAPAVGFAYSPIAARWFRLAGDGVPTIASGASADLTGVFELRAFTEGAELRWRNVSAGRGPAVLVTDTDAMIGDHPCSADPPENDTGGRPPYRLPGTPYRRLLWGSVTATDPASGWVTLHHGRIGLLPVPVSGPVPIGSRVWLRAVEYVAVDEHGNAAVVDERLLGLMTQAEAGRDNR